MNKKIKKFFRKITPPFILDIISYNPNNKYGWFGDYSSWEKASKVTVGYDSALILDKVKSSVLKVKNREAIYERDSVLFNEIQYSFPLLATLIRIGTSQNGKLHIIDFGGSLGSTYFQNKDFLEVLNDIQWNIIEQKHFIDIGKELFEDKILKFHYSIEECLSKDSSNVLLLSGVLHYLEDPFSFIQQILPMNFEYILFDRTPFVKTNKHRITIQHVPPSIYTASYPCWYFNEKLLMEMFENDYDLLYSFKALDVTNIEDGYFKGFVLKRKCV